MNIFSTKVPHYKTKLWNKTLELFFNDDLILHTYINKHVVLSWQGPHIIYLNQDGFRHNVAYGSYLWVKARCHYAEQAPRKSVALIVWVTTQNWVAIFFWVRLQRPQQNPHKYEICFDKIVKAGERRELALCKVRAGIKAEICMLSFRNITTLRFQLLKKWTAWCAQTEKKKRECVWFE